MSLLATGGRIFLARAGQAAAGALVGLLLARALGPAGFGHYQLTVAAVMVAAAVVNGGVGLAAVPSLRRGTLALRGALRAQGLWALAASLLVVALLAAGAASPLWPVARRELGWDGAAAVAAAAAIVALLSFEILHYDLLAVGRLLAGPLLNFGRGVLHLALLAALAALGRLGLASALAVYAASQALAAAGAGALLRSPSRPAAAPALQLAPAWRTATALLRSGWPGQLSAVVGLLHLRLALALVAWFRTPEEVGVYGIAVVVGELLWLLPQALNPILVHSSAGLDSPRERDLLAARAMRLGVLATALATLPLLLLARPLLGLVFGAPYAAAAPALRALLPGIVAYAAGAVLAGDFIGRGHPAWNAQVSALALAIGLAAGLLLVPAHGAVGAAAATSIAYLASSAAMLARFRLATGLSWREILAP